MYFKTYQQSGIIPDWRWTLYASNHKKIADSAEGYRNKEDCLHGIALIKAGAANAPINPGPFSTILGGAS